MVQLILTPTTSIPISRSSEWGYGDGKCLVLETKGDLLQISLYDEYRFGERPEYDKERDFFYRNRLCLFTEGVVWEGVFGLEVAHRILREHFSKEGLPVGLMICGPRFSESRVFALAYAYEQATQWHSKRPPLTPETEVPALITHL